MYGSKQLGGKAWLAVGDFQEIQDKSQSKKKELKGKLILVPHVKILNYQRHWFTLAFKGSLLTTPAGYCQGLWFLTSLWPKDFLSRQETWLMRWVGESQDGDTATPQAEAAYERTGCGRAHAGIPRPARVLTQF